VYNLHIPGNKVGSYNPQNGDEAEADRRSWVTIVRRTNVTNAGFACIFLAAVVGFAVGVLGSYDAPSNSYVFVGDFVCE